MTIEEIQRAVESKVRLREKEAQEKAAFDYKLADLIGISCARVMSSNVEYPSINDAYPSLFETKETQNKQAALMDELSAIRFKQFADNFNKRFS